MLAAIIAAILNVLFWFSSYLPSSPWNLLMRDEQSRCEIHKIIFIISLVYLSVYLVGFIFGIKGTRGWIIAIKLLVLLLLLVITYLNRIFLIFCAG